MGVLVSVVIPVYNGEKYLRQCVESVAAQTISDKIEIILVDDGSADSSPQICDELSLLHENVRTLHRENGGVSMARNDGIAAAKGEYIGFVDCDDTVEPEMYERLLKAAQVSGADMSVCAMRQQYPDKVSTVVFPFEKDKLLGREYICKTVAPYMLENSEFNSLCNKLLRRSVLKENGLHLTEGKKHGEDRELVVRFLICCNGMCYTDFEGYFYRLVEESAVQTPRSDYVDNIFSQYELDVSLFGGFEMEKSLTGVMYDYILARQLIGAVSNVFNKFSGKSRRRAIKRILNDERVKGYFEKNYKILIDANVGFYKLLIVQMKKRSCAGVMLLMLAMRIKTLLHSL